MNVEQLRKDYNHGYYIDCITITFIPDTDYSLLHPKTSHKRFSAHFAAYCKKHMISFIMYPELSKAGMFHYHGLIIQKYSSDQYDLYEKTTRLFRNYVNRFYGRHSCQRVCNLSDEGYAVELVTRKGIQQHTSIHKILKYISKDSDKYSFLQVIKSYNIAKQ